MKRALLIFLLCIAASPAAAQWRAGTSVDRMTDKTTHHAFLASLEDSAVSLAVSCELGSSVNYAILGLRLAPKQDGTARIRFDQKESRAVRALGSREAITLRAVTLREIEASKRLLVRIVGYAGAEDYTFLLDGALTALADIRKHCPS